MASFVQELEQEPYDPEEFVERLAWRCTNSTSNNQSEDEGFDPIILYDTLVDTIAELQVLSEVTHQKVDRLEMIVREDENRHWQAVAELQERNKVAFSRFLDLDERINSVATKVVHLGDQLESVNTPRSRAVEAEKLMNYFAEFLSPGQPISEIFNETSQLSQAADVIHKLHLISQELPAGKFDKAKQKISDMYNKIERSLLEEFVKAHSSSEMARMKEIAGILSHFKGHSRCIDAFIEQSQIGAFVRKDIFGDVVPLCHKNASIIEEVFTNPDQVMLKFIVQIYNGRLQEHIHAGLPSSSDKDQYLRALYDLYSKTNKLSSDLATFNMGTDNTILAKLTKQIFYSHLKDYSRLEMDSLKEKCTAILQRFYESKRHQKKQIQSGGIYDLRRNIQASLGTRANFNIGPSIDDYGGETFLSEEAAINLLQESKIAFRRCQLLSKQSDAADNAEMIFDLLVNYLCVEHIHYALDLGLQSAPLPEPKAEPKLYFLDIIRQSNAIMHLFEKQFNDHLIPIVQSTPKHAICTQKKKEILEQLEQKLGTGLDKTLTSIIGWIKFILQTEQKKADFKVDDETDLNLTAPCVKVVKFLSSCVEKMRDCLDGKNVDVALIELGTRFHRVVYEHLQQFQYTYSGSMFAICDVNEYRQCIQEFKMPLLDVLFDTLSAMCNLLVAKPENLKGICSGSALVSIDKLTILNFLQLRADYKTNKLGSYFK